MHSEAEHKVEEVGCQRLKRVPVPELSAGKVGLVLRADVEEKGRIYLYL